MAASVLEGTAPYFKFQIAYLLKECSLYIYIYIDYENHSGLVSSLSYFFSGDGLHVCDYQLALQRYVKKSPGKYGYL